MDKISIERIQTLHPSIRKKAEQDYLAANKLLPHGVRLRITQALRTWDEQTALYAQGRTKKGIIVTKAKAGDSWHNYGLAIDIVIILDTNNDGLFETASFKIDKYWITVANYLKSQGWSWGGDWNTFKDYPHFELTHGFSLSEARRRYMQRKFIPNTQYITL